MTKSMGASAIADRAGRVSPGASSSLRHTATIPCAIDLNLNGYTLGLARPAIKVYWPPRGRNMIAVIQARVAEYYGIPIGEMTSARRHRGVARPRQVAMYLCRELTPHSLPEIGRRFGKRDHTTVIHAMRKVEQLMREDPYIEEDVAIIRSDFAEKAAA